MYVTLNHETKKNLNNYLILTIPIDDQNSFQIIFFKCQSSNDGSIVKIAIAIWRVMHCMMTWRANDCEPVVHLACHDFAHELDRRTQCKSSTLTRVFLKVHAVIFGRQIHQFFSIHCFRIFQHLVDPAGVTLFYFIISTESPL